MFYDLNVPWSADQGELQQRVAFLAELGYNILALSNLLPAKLLATITSPIALPLPFTTPSKLKLITRCTVPLGPSASNPTNLQLSHLRSLYDIIALRPIDEKSIQQCCSTLDCDLVSLDLSTRYPFHFRHKIFSGALARGVKIELCYGQALVASDSEKRRNLIQNASAIIRSTRGRGIVISSEAANALGCRGPHDIVNLAVLWGLKQEMGTEAVSEAARSVVAAAQLRRRSYRATIDVLYGGTKPETPIETSDKELNKAGKRKAEESPNKAKRSLSKRTTRYSARPAGQDAGAGAASDKASVPDSEFGAAKLTPSEAMDNIT